MKKQQPKPQITDEPKQSETISENGSLEELLDQFGVDKTKADPVILGVCRFLFASVQSQKEQMAELNASIKELSSRIVEMNHKDSHNSSLPPSSDGYKKVSVNKKRSLRTPSTRKPGAQKGHEGKGLQKLEADKIDVHNHVHKMCQGCPNLQKCLGMAHSISTRHQYEVIYSIVDHQHKVFSFSCPNLGGMILDGEFPKVLSTAQQYGQPFRKMAISLWSIGIMSHERIRQMISQSTGIDLATGTIASFIEDFNKDCEGLIPLVEDYLKNAEVKGADETGLRAAGSLHWLHTCCNEKATVLYADQKRGIDAIKSRGILNNAKGILIHDCFSPYFQLDNVKHGVCIQHLEREIVAAIERTPEKAEELKSLKDLLLEVKMKKEELQLEGKQHFTTRVLKSFFVRFNALVRKLLILFPAPPKRKKGKQGRQAEGKTRSLILRMRKFRDAVFLFATNFKAWFTNNFSEQSVRGSKIRQSISKCFRTENGLKQYANITSMMETARKNGVGASAFIDSVFSGQAKNLVMGFFS